MSWKIPLFKICWDDDDVKSVTDSIRSGMNWAVGPKVGELEESLRQYVGAKYCASFNSGTSALHADLLAHGVGQGKEVIVPSFTFIATANAPLFAGAKPVFADIEEQTFGLDPEDVQKKITNKTAAIMPIHFGGCPCKIKELREIAEDRNILLIEDAAEALGAMVDGRSVGTFGNSAMFSFCQNKIVTTGEGGAIVSDSREVIEKLKLIRSHGRNETSDYFSSIEIMDYVTLGYNFRMSNLTAALGVSQMKKADRIIELRRKNAKYMTDRIGNETEAILPQNPPSGYYHVYQMYTVRAKKRDELMNYLADHGIMTKIYFSPVHLTHFYRNVLGYDDRLPITEKMASQVLTLPFYPDIKREEMDFVIDKIIEFYRLR
jgi:perosamine synthetase